MMLFAKIDFTGDAKRAGLTMPRMMLLVFGNPKGGTPVMVAAPSSALDLPLKVLVSEEADGKVWLSFNAPEYLAQRHGIPAELVANIAGIRGLVARRGELVRTTSQANRLPTRSGRAAAMDSGETQWPGGASPAPTKETEPLNDGDAAAGR